MDLNKRYITWRTSSIEADKVMTCENAIREAQKYVNQGGPQGQVYNRVYVLEVHYVVERAEPPVVVKEFGR